MYPLTGSSTLDAAADHVHPGVAGRGRAVAAAGGRRRRRPSGRRPCRARRWRVARSATVAAGTFSSVDSRTSSPVTALSRIFELLTALFLSFERSTAFFLICFGADAVGRERAGGVGAAAEGDEEGERRGDARVRRPGTESLRGLLGSAVLRTRDARWRARARTSGERPIRAAASALSQAALRRAARAPVLDRVERADHVVEVVRDDAARSRRPRRCCRRRCTVSHSQSISPRQYASSNRTIGK